MPFSTDLNVLLLTGENDTQNIYIHHLSIRWPKNPDTSTILYSHSVCYFMAQCKKVGYINMI